jgi:hypothetical protein
MLAKDDHAQRVRRFRRNLVAWVIGDRPTSRRRGTHLRRLGSSG